MLSRAAGEHEVLRCALLIVASIATFGLTGVSEAQEVWELSPYRVRILLSLESRAEFTSPVQERLSRELTDACQRLTGAAWRGATPPEDSSQDETISSSLQVELAHQPLNYEQWFTLDPADLAEANGDCDKLLILRIDRRAGSWLLRARELDIATQRWGTQVTAQARQPRMLAVAGAGLLLKAFAPLARIETVQGRETEIRLKAAALRGDDPAWDFLVRGELFLPVVRALHRDGSVRAVQERDWTWLQPESLTAEDPSLLKCRIHSGLRSPLSSRQRGRVEQLALAVRPPQSSTRLTLHSRTNQQQPLNGFAVYAYTPHSPATELLGYTNRQGEIEVPPGDHPLRLLLVKNGDQLLARLPLAPGAEPNLDAFLPDDDVRLAVEASITGLQDELVDVVVRRAVLLARAERRIDERKLSEARTLLNEFYSLPDENTFLQRLKQLEVRSFTNDPYIKAQIDKLLGDTRIIVSQSLDEREVRAISATLGRVMSGE